MWLMSLEENLVMIRWCFQIVLWKIRGKVTAAIAKGVAESEFEKYRVIQDSLYESDFDRLMNDMENNVPNH